ncbi:hypothetical protein GJA_4095 [Janthinobacterium agaricidamnosum NBRC 102515 = DSM 9628]|uniref:Uncharacterized protein n=1 Tax=Janthinobacterium agaricidamnosum NBRC 102515 = DSM 9628 TaxID=1349767 RepID=W0VAR2_9BURK|nr:hypothetical protein GJA_4095 [Janthinobacterium agaricidamnosum NBRC 102515 = DSM 9628]
MLLTVKRTILACAPGVLRKSAASRMDGRFAPLLCSHACE